MTKLEILKQKRMERYAELEAWLTVGFRTGGTTGTGGAQEKPEDITTRKRAEIVELDRLIAEQETTSSS